LIALCMCSLFSVLVWAGEGTVTNPVAGIEAPLFIPAPETKLPPDGCRYYCIGNFTTSVNGGASDWGMGSSCADAQATFNSALSSRAENNCINSGYLWACSVTPVETASCFFNGTMFQVDGYANYKCMAEVCIE
jgi:hypothetical protein